MRTSDPLSIGGSAAAPGTMTNSPGSGWTPRLEEDGRDVCEIRMEKPHRYVFKKPYDLRERLFEYACAIVQLVKELHKLDEVARALANQILRAGNSAGANYEEANDGSSPADTRGKRRISLRELKEALFRLRVLRATGYLTEEPRDSGNART